MRLTRPILTTAVAALALAACERSADTTEPVAVAGGVDGAIAGPAVDPAAIAPGGPDKGTGTADRSIAIRLFDCEGGHRVELAGEDSARVTLADGRVIELPRRTDGVAEYRGEALTFDIDADGRGGVLGQDEVGGFACEPAD